MHKTKLTVTFDTFKRGNPNEILNFVAVDVKPETCLKCNHPLDFKIKNVMISAYDKKPVGTVQGLCDNCNVVYFVGKTHRMKSKNY